MGVGAIVGAGIFITPGIIAAKYTGPGAMLAFVLAAVVCSLAALCYSEFSSTIPLAGSAYTYIYAVFGEFIAGFSAGHSCPNTYSPFQRSRRAGRRISKIFSPGLTSTYQHNYEQHSEQPVNRTRFSTCQRL